MATAEKVPAEQRFVLYGVPWQTYLALREVPESYHVRMTYDRGRLEMMSPSKLHEQFGHLLGRLIDAWSEESGVDIQGCGTMTCSREDLEKGFEPDKCYYVANEALMRDKAELDLAVDPPPDLAVEIEVTRKSIAKMPLLAAFGVPEVWRYDGRSLQVFALSPEGQYVPRQSSLSFPRLPVAEVERVLRRMGTASETSLVRSFREWVREHVLSTPQGGHAEPGQTA
jgi:Uma2 family endonuclease